MTSIRLPEIQEKFIERVAVLEHTTKSDIIKTAIAQYMDKYNITESPYELGKELFGKHGSGNGSLSGNYKTILKSKLNAKHTH